LSCTPLSITASLLSTQLKLPKTDVVFFCARSTRLNSSASVGLTRSCEKLPPKPSVSEEFSGNVRSAPSDVA
jgi:hypothetical protein